jgi:hypothetical protein
LFGELGGGDGDGRGVDDGCELGRRRGTAAIDGGGADSDLVLRVLNVGLDAAVVAKLTWPALPATNACG